MLVENRCGLLKNIPERKEPSNCAPVTYRTEEESPYFVSIQLLMEHPISSKSCLSHKTRRPDAEIAIHFPALKGPDRSAVLVFTKVKICLECGLTEFEIPERDLQALKPGLLAGGDGRDPLQGEPG